MLREICRRSLSSPKKIVAADWKEGSDGRLSPPDGADGERLGRLATRLCGRRSRSRLVNSHTMRVCYLFVVAPFLEVINDPCALTIVSEREREIFSNTNQL